MNTSHKGMRIDEDDWSAFLGHVNATLDVFDVPGPEKQAVVAFIQNLKTDVVEGARGATA